MRASRTHSEPDARRPAGGVYVVTGAARGIGKACARLLADLGATVLLADVDEQGARATAAEIDDTGRCAAAVALDVSDADAWAAAVREAVSRFGGLDGGVLAAGIARHVPLLEMAPEDWSAMLDVHLTGAFLGIQAIGRALVGSGRGGAIVYVGSSVVAGTGPLHQAHYVAAKAGALGLVRAAARELGPEHVRVNAVSPGFTNTELNAGLFTATEVSERAEAAPLGRIAEPADVANAVAFLLSATSGFVTGQNLQVNGGSCMT